MQLGVLCGCCQRALHLKVEVGSGVLWNGGLSILFEEKSDSEVLFLLRLSFFLCLLFSIAVCSER